MDIGKSHSMHFNNLNKTKKKGDELKEYFLV